MLTKLLAVLNEGRVYSQQDLADKLGVTADMVTSQLEYLAHLGLLRQVDLDSDKSCGGNCKGCGSDCHDAARPVLWEKTSPKKRS